MARKISGIVPPSAVTWPVDIRRLGDLQALQRVLQFSPSLKAKGTSRAVSRGSGRGN